MGPRTCEHSTSSGVNWFNPRFGVEGPTRLVKDTTVLVATWKGGWKLNDHGPFRVSYERRDSKHEVMSLGH